MEDEVSSVEQNKSREKLSILMQDQLCCGGPGAGCGTTETVVGSSRGAWDGKVKRVWA